MVYRVSWSCSWCERPVEIELDTEIGSREAYRRAEAVKDLPCLFCLVGVPHRTYSETEGGETVCTEHRAAPLVTVEESYLEALEEYQRSKGESGGVLTLRDEGGIE